MRMPTQEDYDLSIEIAYACYEAGVRIVKLDNREANLGLTPTLALTVAVRRQREKKERDK